MSARKRTQPARIGKLRGEGRHTWQVRAYAPSATYKHARVLFRDPTTGERMSRNVDTASGQTLDDLFEQIERALDAGVAMTPASDDGTARTMDALWGRYLAHMRGEGLNPNTMANRASMY